MRRICRRLQAFHQEIQVTAEPRERGHYPRRGQEFHTRWCLLVSVDDHVTSLGYECVLPPMLHHFQSPCDNKHHGVAKSKWRTLRSHGDDVVSSLFLLQQLDQVPGDHIKGWFATNFCFDTQDKSEAVLTKALEKLYFGKQAVMHEYHDDCLEAYYARFPAEQVAAEALPARAPTKGYVVTRTA